MKGSMDCYGLKPVISAKYNLWGGFETGESLAEKLNAGLKDPYSVDGYTLVAVHAWSNSVDSLLYVNSLLDDGVRVVAPDEFVSLISEAICGQKHHDEIHLEAFPNPFYDAIRLSVDGYLSDDFNIYMEDLNGKVVPMEMTQIETFNGWIFDLNLPALGTGSYLLHFSTPDGDRIVKVFKYD